MSFFSSWFGDPITEPLAQFKQLCEEEGLPVRIVSTRRTRDQQDALYAQGRTEPGPIVTWTRNSAHVDGRAFDATLVGAMDYEDDPDAWELLGELGQSLGLKWGGAYGDFGHFELPG